mgnify:CR=1
MDEFVVPARAGMILYLVLFRQLKKRSPCTRRDDPQLDRLPPSCSIVVPARAGMILPEAYMRQDTKRSPCTRRDDPTPRQKS